MNEQNNINPTPQQGNGIPATGQPIPTPTQPVTPPIENGQPVSTVPPVQPAMNGEQVVPPSSSVPVMQQPEVPSAVQQPVPPTMNNPTSVATGPVENVSVPPTPVAPVPQSGGTETMPQGQAPVNAMPQAPVAQNIVEQAPLNPIANQPAAPSNGVYGPSIPINGNTDATNVGFVAAAAPLPKKKNKGVIVAVVLVIIAILAVLGYFVVYPYIVKNYLNDPKNVYETSIQAAFKGINNKAEQLVHQKAIYSIEGSFESNIDTLKPYTGYTYGLNMGVDPTNKTIQTGIIIKNETSSTEHSYYRYLKDNKEYVKYSSYRGYIYLGEADLEATKNIFSSFNELFDNADKMSAEDSQYIINKFSELVVASIDESKLAKEDAVIKVNEEELKVTNNKYTMDYEVRCNTVNSIVDGLKKDDKAIEILSKMTETSKEEVIEQLDKAKENMSSSDEEAKKSVTYVHIYTYGLKNDIVGFELTTNQDDSRIYYYNHDNHFDAGMYLVTEDEETGKEEKTSFQLLGVKEGTNTKVTIKSEDKEIGTLTIRKWDENAIDFDYELTIEDTKVNGTITFTSDVNEERAKYTFDGSVNMGEQYIKVSLKFDEDWTSEVANINTDSADTLTDEQLAEKEKEFMDALMETPIGIFFSTVSNDYDPSIYNYYDQNNQGNAFGSEVDNNSVSNT